MTKTQSAGGVAVVVPVVALLVVALEVLVEVAGHSYSGQGHPSGQSSYRKVTKLLKASSASYFFRFQKHLATFSWQGQVWIFSA